MTEPEPVQEMAEPEPVQEMAEPAVQEMAEPVQEMAEAPAPAPSAGNPPETASETPEEPEPLTLVADVAPADLPRLDQAAWEDFVGAIRAEFTTLAASLDQSQVVSCDAGVLVLGLPASSLSAGQVDDARRQVLALLCERIGPFADLELEIRERIEESPYQRREMRSAEEEAARREELSNHPAVQALVTRFEGELKGVVTDREAEGTR
jgi:hypothetical protein